jgi:hypothetical protein
MGCTSAGAEQDAGTLYPTVVEDSSGNQIIVTYMSGVGAFWNNSSSRIYTIEDSRAVQSCGYYCSYQFSYSAPAGQDGTYMSYLSGIASYVGTQENYSVSISPERALYAPNSTGTAFSTAGMLKSVTATGPGDGYPNLGYSWNFSYEQPVACNNPPCLGDGTLTEVQLPQGGYLQWSYSPFEYVGTTTLWEVASRSLQSAVGNSPPPANTYTFTRPSADVSAAITVHSGMTLQDPTGAQKSWSFYCTNPSGYSNCPAAQVAPATFTAEIELASELKEIAPGGSASAPVRDTTYLWTPDLAGNAYLNKVTTTLDEGQAWAQTAISTQTLDIYGNVLTLAVSDYNGGATRTYTNTYSTSMSGYCTSPFQGVLNYICNRLVTSTVTTAGNSVTLVTNTYDTGGLSQTPGVRELDPSHNGPTVTRLRRSPPATPSIHSTTPLASSPVRTTDRVTR